MIAFHCETFALIITKHKGSDDKAAFHYEYPRNYCEYILIFSGRGRCRTDKCLLLHHLNGSTSFRVKHTVLVDSWLMRKHFNSKLYLQYMQMYVLHERMPWVSTYSGEIAVIKLIVRELSTKFVETCDRNWIWMHYYLLRENVQ